MLLKIRDNYIDLSHVRCITSISVETIMGRMRMCFTLNVGGSEIRMGFKERKTAELVRTMLAQASGGSHVYTSFLELQNQLATIEENE